MVGAHVFHVFNDKEAFILLKVAIEREGAGPRLQIVIASIAPACCYREVIYRSYLFLISCILHESLNRETMDGCGFVWCSPRVSPK
jgi:hypothetical protein